MVRRGLTARKMAAASRLVRSVLNRRTGSVLVGLGGWLCPQSPDGLDVVGLGGWLRPQTPDGLVFAGPGCRRPVSVSSEGEVGLLSEPVGRLRAWVADEFNHPSQFGVWGRTGGPGPPWS